MANNKPTHRLQLTFAAREMPNRPPKFDGEAWKILPEGQEYVFTFDSDVALCQPRPEYFEGHSPQQATGKCWYSWMGPTPYGRPEMSLRVFWWEVNSGNRWWIAGAILNESMEAPIGMLRGRITAKLDHPDYPDPVEIDQAVVPDERGCVFSFGEPITWVDSNKLPWFLNRFRKGPEVPPEYFWAPQPCPDARQGNEWQAQ